MRGRPSPCGGEVVREAAECLWDYVREATGAVLAFLGGVLVFLIGALLGAAGQEVPGWSTPAAVALMVLGQFMAYRNLWKQQRRITVDKRLRLISEHQREDRLEVKLEADIRPWPAALLIKCDGPFTDVSTLCIARSNKQLADSPRVRFRRAEEAEVPISPMYNRFPEGERLLVRLYFSAPILLRSIAVLDQQP